jgi:receptor protein-tyrosine kinase
MSRNFELLQQTSSVQDLFETSGNPAGLMGTAECEPRPAWSEKPELFETADNPAGLMGTAECEPRPRWSEKPELFETADNPAGLVGAAECEPRPAWSEKPELFETADNPAGLVGAAECEPRPTWSEKPEQRAVKSKALPIHLADLIREKARSWGEQVQKQTKERRTDLEAISREEEIKLVHRIFPAGGQRSPQIVLFSAVESDAGCASICVRTAMILAARGDGSVCVVDANLRAPCLHHYFGIDNSRGLAEAVLEPLPIQDFAQKHVEPNLWILPGGSAAGQLSFPGAYDRLSSRMTELRGQFKYVVIYSSPLDLDSASILLSSWTDGVVMVVEADTTRRETARRMKRNLDAANVSVLGVVLNNRSFSIPEALYRRL